MVTAALLTPAKYELNLSKERYKTDACIIDSDSRGISSLETFGKIVVENKSKYGCDPVSVRLEL
jgi:hypothetical protein